MPLTPPFERRLSLNGRNAYISLISAESETTTTTKCDDSLYLSAKPTNRAHSLSPHVLSSALKGPNQKEEDMQNNQSPKSMPQNSEENQTRDASSTQNGAANSTGAIPKIKNAISGNKIQTGLDRYILVTKRKANSRSPREEPKPKTPKCVNQPSQNRFSILSTEDGEELQPESVREHRPPPIYLREQTSNLLVSKLSQLLGKDNFHVVTLRRGNVAETKIQTYNEASYKKVVASFEQEKKNYYTYQLKSSKGLVVIVKGIDSSVSIQEVKAEVERKGFEVKSVINIINKDKVPQPMFKVELTFESSKVNKKGDVHPIYNVRYLCNRKITVDEPLKRKDPPQCINCQEFGHTKTYCRLPPVCVRCGDVHKSIDCPYPRTDSSVKKCSNCGEKHTANYRGCPVYVHIKNTMRTRKPIIYKEYKPTPFPGLKPTSRVVDNRSNVDNVPDAKNNSMPSNMSYAHTLRNNAPIYSNTPIENSLEKLIETMNTFMMNMHNMMQEMMRNQSMLMQIVLNQK